MTKRKPRPLRAPKDPTFPIPEMTPSGGRPLKFPSVEKLEEAIDAYFRECDREEDTRIFAHGPEELEEIPYIDEKTNKRKLKKRIVCSLCRKDMTVNRGCKIVSGELKLRKPYTTTGLAVWLDTSRLTLLQYEVRPEFVNTIKRAKQRIENYGEEQLFDKNVPTKGATFSLSNNHDGWAEKIETKDTSLSDLIKAQEATTPPADAGDPAA